MHDNPLQDVIADAVRQAVAAISGSGTTTGSSGDRPPGSTFPVSVTTADTVDNGAVWPFMIGHDAIGDTHAVIRVF